MRTSIVVLAVVLATVGCGQKRKAQENAPPPPPESAPIEAACPTGGNGAYILQVAPVRAGISGFFRIDYTTADGKHAYWAGPFRDRPTARSVKGLAQIDSVALSDSSNELRSMKPLKIQNGFGCELRVDRS